MELPSTRELELETLVRLRDTQLAELTDELAHLRQFLVSQPGPSTSNPVTLPPALVSVLLPRLNQTSPVSTTSGSNAVNAALTQRARLLQEENDELYDLLKQSETGKLKEEVRSLRRVVFRLESALKESHQAISSLSSELDKSYETFMSSARISNNSPQHGSQSPHTNYHGSRPTTTDSGNGIAMKPTPTGPRAHKKARLSETGSQGSPPQRGHLSLGPPAVPAGGTHKRYGRSNSSPRGADTREYAARRSVVPDGRGGQMNHHHHHYQKMEVDGQQRQPQQQQQRGRVTLSMQERGERERDRDRRMRDKESERDGQSHRSYRRNGGVGGRGGRRYEHGQVTGNSDSTQIGDRTLRERISGL